MERYFLCISLLLTVTTFKLITSERLHEQIYSSIEGGAACFRILNGTHQVGCSSTDKGAVGIVQMITSIDDAQWIAFNSSAGQYMAIVNVEIYDVVVELLMKYPSNVAGIVIFNNSTSSISSFTQESTCPNEDTSAPGSMCPSSSGLVWNKKGTGLLRKDIPFPILYLPESRLSEIDKINECYLKFNLDKSNQKGTPLCSVQLNSFMFAAVNSEICLRRSATSALFTATKVCDPLVDNNVYYSLFPRSTDKITQNKSITLVTARIDSATLLDGVSPGAASSVVGTVTLLTAAATLAQMIPFTDAHLYDKNVMWTLFNGEAFDYIGSQRVAYDLKMGTWPPNAPLLPSHIELHAEIGQIGGAMLSHANDSLWPLTVFTPPYQSINSEISDFLQVMKNNNIEVTNITTANLPPSSLHSFRRILTNVTTSGELPELLLVDHNETFTNMFYNSPLDEYDKINFVYHNISIGSDGSFKTTEELLSNGTMKDNEPQVKISRLATNLATTLYQRITGKPYDGKNAASAHLVDEMLYCFLQNQGCRLLLAADYGQNGGGEQLPSKPAPLYIGVATWSSTASVFAGHLLALLTGGHLSLNKTQCDQLSQPGFSHYWLRGWNHTGVCIQTTMNFSQALSPAFLIQDYDMKSGEYSTWAESVWQVMWARVFVSAGGGGATAAAVTGCIATALVAVVTYWLQRHASQIFINVPTTSIVNDDAASGILRTVNC